MPSTVWAHRPAAHARQAVAGGVRQARQRDLSAGAGLDPASSSSHVPQLQPLRGSRTSLGVRCAPGAKLPEAEARSGRLRRQCLDSEGVASHPSGAAVGGGGGEQTPRVEPHAVDHRGRRLLSGCRGRGQQPEGRALDKLALSAGLHHLVGEPQYAGARCERASVGWGGGGEEGVPLRCA
jgi:hypothetical protein